MSGGQLTWRNVDAPSFSGGNDAFRTAALLLGKAASPVQEAMAQFQAEDRLRQSAIAQANVLTSANPMTALQSGTALAGIDPGMLSQEAIANMGMEAQRRANVGNTLATTANTRANTVQTNAQTDRYTQLTPLELESKRQSNSFESQINPIKVDAARTSADAAKLSLQLAVEGNDIATNSRKTLQSLAQSGALATNESRIETIRNLESAGVDPRIIANVKAGIAAGSAPITGSADALTLGQPSLSANTPTNVRNPFNNDTATAIKAYMPKMFGAEGGSTNGGMVPNKAGASSAFGPAQFTDGTWIDTVRENDPATFMRLGGNKNAILGLRTDQSYHRLMAEKFTEGNAKALPAGVPVNDASLYAMHFFGRGAGPKVLTADASTPISQLVGADAIAANPFLKGMNAGQARAWAENAISKKGGVGPTVANAQAMEANGSPTANVAPTPAYSPLTSAPSSDPVKLLQQANDLSNTANSLVTQTRIQSNLYDKDASIAKALAAPNDGRSQSDIIDAIAKKGANQKDDPEGFIGRFWSNASRSTTGITNAMNYLRDNYGLAPGAAGAIIENNMESVNKWFSSDYQTVDTNQLDKFMEQYIDKDTKRPKEAILNKGTSLVNADKANAAIESRVQLYSSVQQSLRDSLANAIEANRERGTPVTQAAVDKARDKLAENIKAIQVDLKKMRSSSDLTDKARQRQ